MVFKKIWSIIVTAVMAACSLLGGYFIFKRAGVYKKTSGKIKKKAEKAKEEAIEKVLDTPASDVGNKYLDPSSVAGIDLAKQSALKRIMARIRRGPGEDYKRGDQPGR